MSDLKVHGLVIREAPMGDKDKRLVLLTEETGKLPVVAKGALSARSRFRACANLLCYGEFVLTRGRTFYYLKEATLLENFYDVRLNVTRLAYASLLMETAETLSLDGQDNQHTVRLLVRALTFQEKAKEGFESLPAETGIFRLLAQNGFYPDLSRCQNEGHHDEVPQEHDLSGEGILFLPERGAIYCPDCRKNGRVPFSREDGVVLSPGALKALRYMLEMPDEKAFRFTVTPRLKAQIDKAVTGYLTAQTERSYKSLDFLRELSENKSLQDS